MVSWMGYLNIKHVSYDLSYNLSYRSCDEQRGNLGSASALHMQGPHLDLKEVI